MTINIEAILFLENYFPTQNLLTNTKTLNKFKQYLRNLKKALYR